MKIKHCFVLLLVFFLQYTVVTAQKAIKAGVSFHDYPSCPDMIVIPAGSFTIGTPAAEPDRSAEEGPQKKIIISAFAIGKFDITKKQWKAFVKATSRPIIMGCAFSGIKDSAHKDWQLNPNASWNHLGFEQTENDPVVCISWDEAQAYVMWLNKQTRGGYRLLSESEWEYAARAGTTTAFPWGDTPSHEFANYGADSGWTGLAKGRDRWLYTSPVGSFPANAFGLYDMVGNVLQYTNDCFAPTYTELPADGSSYNADVPIKMTGRMSFMNSTRSCGSKIVRGGDWGDPPRMIRSGFRNWAPGRGITLQDYRSGGVGFRVGKTL